MKRSDEIVEALKTFFEKYECKMDADTKLLYVGAFTTGVTWADQHPKNVWHGASEEPTAYQWEILCEDNSEMRWVANHFDAAGDWNSYASEESIARWAYISDLLPKGDEK